MGTDTRIFFLGEDIKDPYGGPFKVTRGLSEKYPDRVVNTPISEAGIIGLAIGMAVNGLKPVVEMMFGDFISLGFDQILNHATKYNWMYASQVHVPVLIRIPSGGGRGYGATHSQSLEKFFAGIPNLNIIALSQLHDPQILAERILTNITSPTFLIENKMMYSKLTLPVTALRSEGWNVSESQTRYPVIRLTYDETVAADVTIITYGALTATAINVAKQFMLDREIMVNVISMTQISPVDYPNIISMISGCTKIVTLEEGTKRLGIGAEIVSTLAENLRSISFLRIASRDCVIPAGMELERYVFNDANDIFSKIGAFLNEQY
jgi:2-oxoisovalerate dehydrogenase E1 component